ICADEMGIAKEDPVFWDKLADRIDFDKERTLLADDNEVVLASADQYGIANLIFVAKSSSRKPTVYSKRFPSIIFFKELMDMRP
ncbi:MAG: haloacid dehalogenase, partial [Deltaproteobacteria bacterium]|nr:haloacid dehalogenase [Deltaproteobacteria bacterium]